VRRAPSMSDAFDDAYTGILTRLSRIPRRADDPDVRMWGGVVPPWGPRGQELTLGGAGWDDDGARQACIGEAIERVQAYPLPGDGIVESRFSEWKRPEPAIGPGRWTLFHPDQQATFTAFTPDQLLRWVCFREAITGLAQWIPQDFGYLFHESGPRLAPSYSTGLSCGRADHPVLLRGLQEVIERDAMVGAWWGSYPLEEWTADDVFRELDPSIPRRVLRPNRRYRFYRARSPFSDHATMATVEVDGLFAAGSACRETRALSWTKSLLEAIQGAAYVRQLRADRGGMDWVEDRSDFAHHAAYYTAHPEQLRETVLEKATAPDGRASSVESVATLRERLGPERPVLCRIMTPTGIAEAARDWIVLRVVVPGLQPLHGNDRWPHLGGPLWGRPVSDWAKTPPHPFA